MDFASFVEHEGKGKVSNELSFQWACLPPNAARLYQARRLEIVRCFARFLAVFEPETEIPPKGIYGPAHRRTPAHIFSDRELELIFAACDELDPKDGLRPKTFKTLLGLLLVAGLRISEVLKLQFKDVDLQNKTITIRESKFHKSRMLPIHTTSCSALINYSLLRAKYQHSNTNTFFISEKGNALVYSTIRHTFRKICDDLGLKNNNPDRPRPRFYDFRHTFACKVIMRWQNSGEDVEQLLPILSTYLGHVKVADTYWYLTGIPELFASAGKSFENYVSVLQPGGPQ